MRLVDALCDPSRPVFTIGTPPPREGTSNEAAIEGAEKFAAINWKYPFDGFIVYDIQDEAGRTTKPRPFPFKPTIDPCLYGYLITQNTGKDCVIYKSVGEPSIAAFDRYLDRCIDTHHHHALNLVGAATSKRDIIGPTIGDAAQRVGQRANCKFGCVTIAERHLTKGNEHLNIQRKVDLGAEWFISQAVYNFGATISLINDYGDSCREKGIVPKKFLLTFAPCGRRKTMDFIHWLGVSVPPHVEDAILENAPPVGSSIPDIKRAAAVSVITCNKLLIEGFQSILEATASSGVPLGLNVESVSGYKEECEAVSLLFEGLQQKLLNFNKKWRFAVRLVEIGATDEEKEVRTAYHQSVTILEKSNALQFVGAAGFGVLLAFVMTKMRQSH